MRKKAQLVPLLGPPPPLSVRSVISLCFQSQEISFERVLEKKQPNENANSSKIVVNSKTTIVSRTRYCNFLTFTIEDSYPHTSSALAWPTSFGYPFACGYKKYNRILVAVQMKLANKRLTAKQPISLPRSIEMGSKIVKCENLSV